ncbi:MAG: hypothetical protein HDT44_02585 [Ruminococcaceae bacterium]|nr:hypothetical protein [Oscillospiraceae bacterium]
MMEKKESFNYSYSAAQQAEIKRIREKYVPREESKMERLRRLDESAAKPGMIAGIIIGVLGTLVMGVGMCCTMVWADRLFIPGIVIGVLGMACIVAAYPVYSFITKKKREKLAPDIIRLTDELLK